MKTSRTSAYLLKREQDVATAIRRLVATGTPRMRPAAGGKR